jgi:hypothetical protein
MSNKITILDARTGQITEKPATSDELTSIASAEADELEAANQRQARASARTSALAKLAALGLTEDEIAAL